MQSEGATYLQYCFYCFNKEYLSLVELVIMKCKSETCVPAALFSITSITHTRETFIFLSFIWLRLSRVPLTTHGSQILYSTEEKGQLGLHSFKINAAWTNKLQVFFQSCPRPALRKIVNWNCCSNGPNIKYELFFLFEQRRDQNKHTSLFVTVWGWSLGILSSWAVTDGNFILLREKKRHRTGFAVSIYEKRTHLSIEI